MGKLTKNQLSHPRGPSAGSQVPRESAEVSHFDSHGSLVDMASTLADNASIAKLGLSVTASGEEDLAAMDSVLMGRAR